MTGIKRKITGILLAGGMSKRMGKEKGHLFVGDAPLYTYPLRALEKLCDEVLISSCQDAFSETGYPVICDEIKNVGPLGGIFSSLKQSSNDLNLVLSYDLPLVSTQLLEYLLEQSKGFELVWPVGESDRPEPLCGIYQKKLYLKAEKLIRDERYAVHNLRPLCKHRLVNIPKEMNPGGTDVFLNINRPSDLNKIPPGFGEEK